MTDPASPSDSAAPARCPLRILVWLGIGLWLVLVAAVLIRLLWPVNVPAGVVSGPVAPIEGPSRRASLPPLSLSPIGRELSKVRGVSIKRVESASQYGDASVFGPDGAGRITVKCKEVAIQKLVSMMVPSENDWVFDDAELPDAAYSVNAKDVKPAILVKALETTFGLKIGERPRECEVYLLSRDARRALKLRPAKAESVFWRSGGPGWEFGRKSMSGLAGFLEGELGDPVLDETGLTGEYDFEIAASIFHPEELIAAVGQLGLRLEKSRRVLKVVVIERAPPAPPVPAGNKLRSGTGK